MHRFNKCMLLITKGKFDWRYMILFDKKTSSNCRLQGVKIKNCRFVKCRSGCNFIQTKVHGQGHSEKIAMRGRPFPIYACNYQTLALHDSVICTACCWLKLMNLMFHSGGHCTCQMSSPATIDLLISCQFDRYIYPHDVCHCMWFGFEMFNIRHAPLCPTLPTPPLRWIPSLSPGPRWLHPPGKRRPPAGEL